MKGYPFFLTLDDMATLVFWFLAVGCQILISSNHGSWIIMYILHSDFQFSNFQARTKLFLCALRYLGVSFKSMAIAKHRSQHNFAQFSSI